MIMIVFAIEEKDGDRDRYLKSQLFSQKYNASHFTHKKNLTVHILVIEKYQTMHIHRLNTLFRRKSLKEKK